MPFYDFVEIGTSDFATLIQRAKAGQTGLSVEPLSEYLDRLPDVPGVRKVVAAVSATDGELLMYYVPDDVRVAHGLPGWMRGTNSLGVAHPTVCRYLAKHGLPSSLIATRTVPVLSVARLFHDYDISGVRLLKIDTEGHDIVILNAYLDMTRDAPHLRATTIRYETNNLTARAEQEALRQRLVEQGYTVRSASCDTVAQLSNTVVE